MLPYSPPPLDTNQRKAAAAVAQDLAAQIHGIKPRKGLYTLRVPEGTYNLIALFLHHIETSGDQSAS